MSPLLSIQNLKTFIETPGKEPPVKAVDGVNLDLFPGELLALVGESGCGKTMLALSIGRLLPPFGKIVQGRIFFEETDLTTLSEEKLCKLRGRRIAYVFQDPFTALNPVLRIGDQLAESLSLHQNLTGKAAWEKAKDLLDQVQIPLAPERLRQYPHQLSGGMLQRVVIAMALAGGPSLLIADEPTTSLDVTTQAEILSLLKRLQKELTMAILLITHDLAAVAPLADRIVVMYAGRIVEEAKTQRLYGFPQHPYTQALLSCIPKVGLGRQSLAAIPGSVPDLRTPPSGCPFHPRCPEAISQCREEEPSLKETFQEQKVSCWRREPGVKTG